MREENIVTISGYLSRMFQGSPVGDEEAGDDHLFTVEGGGPGGGLRLTVSEEFLDDTPPLETGEELERFDVAGAMRRAPGGAVLLTPRGAEPAEG